MVDLDCAESTKPPPAGANNMDVSEEPLASKDGKQLCRLCLLDEDTSEKVFDIFEDVQMDEKGNKIKGLADVLYELFQIKVCDCAME